MDILNTAASNVSNATSSAGVTNVMTILNSIPFNNTNPPTNLIENIKTWLRGVQSMYNTTQCPINLTATLQIGSATSTTQ